MSQIINLGAGSVSGLLGWYDVFSYLTQDEQEDVASWTGNLDVSTSVQKAITAFNNSIIGGVLYFRPGEWQINTSMSITVPFHIMGMGIAATDAQGNISTRGITQIVTTTANITLFSVSTTNSIYGLFSNISLANVSGTQTSGAAILVDSTDENTAVDFENVQTSNFFIGIDSKVNQAWHMRGCRHEKFTSIGLRVRNTVNADAGDWEVTGNVFLAKNGALASIDVESSGGGKIALNKFNVISGALAVDGIKVNVNASKQLQVIGNNAENLTGSALNVPSGFAEIIVLGNNFNVAQGVNPAIVANGAPKLTLGYNTLTGATGPAITLTNCTNVLLGPELFAGFTSNVSLTSCTGVSDWTNTGSIATGSLNIATGTITVNTPAVSATQTWNAGGVTFTGELVNVTDISSATASRLYAGQVAGTDKFYARKDGLIFGVRFSTNPGLSAVIPSYGIITTGYYASGVSSPLAYVLAGHTTFDGVITGDASADNFYLGTTSDDATLHNHQLKWNDTGLFTNMTGFMLRSEATITGGSTANVPTLTAGPVAGNPTKWLPYDDNGTTRYIPSW